jgi:hypothetical protein
VKGTTLSDGPVNWKSWRIQASSTVAFSLLYIRLCRIFSLVVSYWRTESDLSYR